MAGQNPQSKLFYLRNIITSTKCITVNDLTAPIVLEGRFNGSFQQALLNIILTWNELGSPAGFSRSIGYGCCCVKAVGKKIS